MGRVVNKSFKKVREDIAKKSDKLLTFLQDNSGNLFESNWTAKQNRIYEKLSDLCFSLTEEVNNLDEIEVPDFEKSKD